MARTAPMNGANEKYAPVRAAPRCRRARTKSTRLTPIPKKPTMAMAPVMLAAGKAAPLSMASPVFTVPAARPLIVAVSNRIRGRQFSGEVIVYAPGETGGGDQFSASVELDPMPTPREHHGPGKDRAGSQQ